MNGQELKVARDALGLTQDELGELLGVRKETVLRYESGAMTIPLNVDVTLYALGFDPAISAIYKQLRHVDELVERGEITADDARHAAVETVRLYVGMMKPRVLEPDFRRAFMIELFEKVERERARRAAESKSGTRLPPGGILGGELAAAFRAGLNLPVKTLNENNIGDARAKPTKGRISQADAGGIVPPGKDGGIVGNLSLEDARRLTETKK